MQLGNQDSRKIADVETLVQGSTAFALELFRKLKGTEDNLFFSPYGIYTVLAMVYAGSRGNTKDQMAQVLNFLLDQRQLHPTCAALQAVLDVAQEVRTVQIKIGSALWPQKGYSILEEFFALVKEHYGVLITPVDFASNIEMARQRINSWAEEKTEGKIRNLISSHVLDDLTRLVLTNAVFFKGNWANQFDQNFTKNAWFWIKSDQKIQVPMMMEQRKFNYAENGSMQILELPYDGDTLSMIVLLPKKVDGLADLEEIIVNENLKRWTRALDESEVLIFLPRFKITSQFELKNSLLSMGMIDAFDKDRADFSGIDGAKKWLYISSVIHKAFINVDEEGTEAAAATSIVEKVKGPAVSIPVFEADHPFVFLIRENSTGSILFLGKLVNPLSRTI